MDLVRVSLLDVETQEPLDDLRHVNWPTPPPARPATRTVPGSVAGSGARFAAPLVPPTAPIRSGNVLANPTRGRFFLDRLYSVLDLKVGELLVHHCRQGVGAPVVPLRTHVYLLPASARRAPTMSSTASSATRLYARHASLALLCGNS